jgi:hypothetical protein
MTETEMQATVGNELASAFPNRTQTMAATTDPLDDFIAAAAAALDLPLEAEWQSAIKANLDVTLKHASFVAAFELPDEAEPAPIFRA